MHSTSFFKKTSKVIVLFNMYVLQFLSQLLHVRLYVSTSSLLLFIFPFASKTLQCDATITRRDFKLSHQIRPGVYDVT